MKLVEYDNGFIVDIDPGLLGQTIGTPWFPIRIWLDENITRDHWKLVVKGDGLRIWLGEERDAMLFLLRWS